MCKVIVNKWDQLKSTAAADLLKGKFPACGVKYTGKYGDGLVVAKRSASIHLIGEKAKAASQHTGKAHVFLIPKQIEEAAGI